MNRTRMRKGGTGEYLIYMDNIDTLSKKCIQFQVYVSRIQGREGQAIW